MWRSSIKYGEAERSWSAPTHPGPAWSISIEMEITFYLQFQHPPCSPQGSRLGPSLSVLGDSVEGAEGCWHSVSQAGVWGEQGCSEALGSRLSSLILSGQQRPVTVSSMLMVKHTLCPHHLPGHSTVMQCLRKAE